MFRYTCLCLTGCPCLRGRRPHPRSTSLRFVNYVVSPAPRFVSSLLLVAPRFSRGKVIWSRDISPRMASLWTAVDVGRPKSQQIFSSTIVESAYLCPEKVGVSCHDRSTAVSSESPSWLRTLSSLPSEHPRSARKAALTQYHGVQAPQPSRWS